MNKYLENPIPLPSFSIVDLANRKPSSCSRKSKAWITRLDYLPEYLKDSPSISTKSQDDKILTVKNVHGLKEAYKLGNLTAFEDGSINKTIKSKPFTRQLKSIHKYLINKYGEWIDLQGLKNYLKARAKIGNIKKRLMTLNNYIIEASNTSVKKVIEIEANSCRLKIEVLNKCTEKILEKV